MNLKHLTDETLLKEIKYLVIREREVTTKVLYYLKEIDRRKLYSDLKCTSLYDYCTRVLGYPEASAQRRIQAARLLGDIPEIKDKIETGALSLTNISQAASFFKDQGIKNPKEKKVVLKEIENLSKKECEKKLFEISGMEKKVNQNKVTLTLYHETFVKMNKVKGYLNKEVTNDELVTTMADLTIEKLKKEKFKLNKEYSVKPVIAVSRVIPNQVKREVYKRDKVCTNCGSEYRLNFDHRRPYALGGLNHQENIRLLCFHCNQRARIRAKL